MLLSVQIFSCCHGIQWRQMGSVYFYLQYELQEGYKIQAQVSVFSIWINIFLFRKKKKKQRVFHNMSST